jgi:hypothetical protein
VVSEFEEQASLKPLAAGRQASKFEIDIVLPSA